MATSIVPVYLRFTKNTEGKFQVAASITPPTLSASGPKVDVHVEVELDDVLLDPVIYTGQKLIIEQPQMDVSVAVQGLRRIHQDAEEL